MRVDNFEKVTHLVTDRQPEGPVVAALAALPVELLVSDWLFTSKVPPARTTVPALFAGGAVMRIVPPAPAIIVPAAELVGAAVNLECDILGKYVARALELRGIR